jgi:hypothetical protein
MANPYHPYQSEENMMRAFAANHAILEADRIAAHAANVASMAASLQESKRNEARKQEQIDIIRGLLISNGLVLIDTEGDGNCFYYALQGYGLIKNIPKLSVDTSVMRQNLAGFIRGIRNTPRKSGSNIINNGIIADILSLETAYLKREYKDSRNLIEAYCTEIQKDKQWASDIDITILARELDKCITTRIVSNDMLGQPQPHSTKSTTCNDPIQLSWTSGNHYSLLMPENDPDYIALRNFGLEQGIPLKLPLDQRLTEFLRDYHRKKSRSSLPHGTTVQSSSTKPAQAASSSSSKSSVPWKCPVCTFINPHDSRMCQMCGTEKGPAQAAASSSPRPLPGHAQAASNNVLKLSLGQPSAAAASKSMSGISAASPIVLNGLNMPWKCPVCTFDNKPGATSCEACGTKRSAASLLPGASAIALNGVRGKSEQRAAQSAAPNSGSSAAAAASSSSNVIYEKYIDLLLTQISTLQEEMDKERIKPMTPAIEAYLKIADKQLKDRLEIATNLGLKLGGTRKHKKLRKTRQRKTRQKRTKNNRKSKRKVRK